MTKAQGPISKVSRRESSAPRSLPFIAALLMVFSHVVEGADPPAKTNETVRTLELRGRVVCLAEEMHRRHSAELLSKHEHLWSFNARDGKTYTLLRAKFSERDMGEIFSAAGLDAQFSWCDDVGL